MEKIDPVLREAAVRVFGEEPRAMQWLSTPARELGDMRPIDAELHKALDLLARLDHGFVA